MGDKEDSVRFGEKLRELRVSANVSPDELAKAIDVDKSAISKWEDGLPARPQSPHRIRQIAEALDVSEFPLMVAAGGLVPPRRSGHVQPLAGGDHRVVVDFHERAGFILASEVPAVR